MFVDQSAIITLGELKSIKTDESRKNNFFPITWNSEIRARQNQFICFLIMIMFVFLKYHFFTFNT